jgi:hypothetical protein
MGLILDSSVVIDEKAKPKPSCSHVSIWRLAKRSPKTSSPTRSTRHCETRTADGILSGRLETNAYVKDDFPANGKKGGEDDFFLKGGLEERDSFFELQSHDLY